MWHNAKEKTPPKNRVFLAKIKDYPWAVQCVWNPATAAFLYQILQSSLYHGEQDLYFESEFAAKNEITAWQEMPEAPKGEFYEQKN